MVDGLEATSRPQLQEGEVQWHNNNARQTGNIHTFTTTVILQQPATVIKIQVHNFKTLGECLMVFVLPVEGASEVGVEDAVHDGVEGAVKKEEKQHHCVGERRDLLPHLDSECY